MIRFFTMASLLFANAVFAQVEIPHVHENGDVIDANEINQNLDIVAKAVPPRDCLKDQTIKWDGSAWVCTSDPFAGLDCSVGDQLVLGPNGWKCSSTQHVVTGSVTFNNWQKNGPDGNWPCCEDRSLAQLDTTVVNMDPTSFCNKTEGGVGVQIGCGFIVLGADGADPCAVSIVGSEKWPYFLISRNGGTEWELSVPWPVVTMTAFESLPEGTSTTLNFICFATA